jgi:aryl-alcohol dehydrogenase-like predicted oxidoreductase
MASGWAVGEAGVTRVGLPIPGTLSQGHLRENLAALEIEPADEEYQALA